MTGEKLLETYHSLIKEILQKSIDKGNGSLPFADLFTSGYRLGLKEASNGKVEMPDESQIWHYIEAEGYPPEEEQCLWLIECDRYYDTSDGYYRNGKIDLSWHNPSTVRIVAWHRLPDLPNWKS